MFMIVFIQVFRNMLHTKYINIINKILFISFVTIYVLGCSSIYRLSDFPSKKNFYEDFNKSAYNKSLTITLINDSSFSVPCGALISNDYLQTILNIKKRTLKLKHSSIKEIKTFYKTNFANPQYKVILSNGEELKGKDIKFLPDSSVIYTVKENIYGSEILLNKVREVSYNNHWLGIPTMLITGTLFGFATGYLINSSIGVNNLNDNQAYYIGWGSTVIGTLIGSVAGYLIGYNYIYKFNP